MRSHRDAPVTSLDSPQRQIATVFNHSEPTATEKLLVLIAQQQDWKQSVPLLTEAQAAQRRAEIPREIENLQEAIAAAKKDGSADGLRHRLRLERQDKVDELNWIKARQAQFVRERSAARSKSNALNVVELRAYLGLIREAIEDDDLEVALRMVARAESLMPLRTDATADDVARIATALEAVS